MDKFFTLPNADKKEAFEETGIRQAIPSVIVEKDFWVCWTLQRIFENTQLAPYITFKGGTSLSKAYRLIDRFSEDIDLTISRDAPHLSDTPDPMEQGITGKEHQRRIDTLKAKARQFVTEHALPLLQKSLADKLPGGWELMLDADDPDQQTILFQYPKLFNYKRGMNFSNWNFNQRNFAVTEYIKPIVKLEFGARGDISPSENKHIAPYVAETFPQLFEAVDFAVPVLTAERTFWEKVTILHALHHKSNLRDRMSRHYYDTFVMAQKGIADSAFQDIALLERVVRNKSLMFADKKASYDTAVIGSLRLIPKEEMMPELKRDYVAMREMFLAEAPEFEVIMSTLLSLEKQINGLKIS